MKLILLKDDIRGNKKGKILEYQPWDYEWQNMNEEERVSKGIFVFCHGHGDFMVYKKGVDVMQEQEQIAGKSGEKG